MELRGGAALIDAARRNKPLANWLVRWAAVVEQSEWRNIDDVHREYPSADGVKLASGNVITIFNVKGNQFRLLCSIDYGSEVAVALEVPTHAEYHKNKWKQRY